MKQTETIKKQIREMFREKFPLRTLFWKNKLATRLVEMEEFLDQVVDTVEKECREETRRKTISETREEIKNRVSDMKIDILGQFAYQGPPSKGWIKKEMPLQESFNQAMDKVIDLLSKP